MSDNWMEIMSRREDLVPELQEYYEEGEHWPMIRHPLVFSVPHNEQQNAMCNHRLKLAKESVHKAMKDKDLGRYLVLHERAYRLQAFIDFVVAVDVHPEMYYKHLAWVYTDTENLWQNFDTWHDLLCKRDGTTILDLMTESERKALDAMPQELTLYRGYKYDDSSQWLAWTLDKEKAEWFSERFGGGGKVARCTLDKRNAIAYFEGRGEQEIVASPLLITDLEMTI
ncbi:MAG: hypothetical protein K0U20_08260 [Proteobacteria bacterium]|nr:hypothetical protein [Pseudomonadota bacterium]